MSMNKQLFLLALRYHTLRSHPVYGELVWLAWLAIPLLALFLVAHWTARTI
jgi:hypothetical protein